MCQYHQRCQFYQQYEESESYGLMAKPATDIEDHSEICMFHSEWLEGETLLPAIHLTPKHAQ